MDGSRNARDLGGLPTLAGGRTRHGVYIRSADPGPATGWRDRGVRTVVDLRNDDERGVGTGLPTVHVPLDDIEDREFWQEIGDRICCPLYYPPFLRRKAERCAAAITALARAEPGVLFHCKAGRDRTGLVTILLLSLVGVTPAAITADYLRAAAATADQAPLQVLAREGTTAKQAVEAVLDGLDAESYLLDAGTDPADIATIRARLT